MSAKSLLFFLFIASNLVAQNLVPYQVQDLKNWDAHARWGYKNLNFKVIIQPINEMPYLFNDAVKYGYAVVNVLRKTGLEVATSTKNNALGIAILDKIVPLYALTDCENLTAFSIDYYRFGDEKKGGILEKQARACKQKKTNDSLNYQHYLRRNERNFHFLLGINLIPAFSNSYGGVLNIGAKNFIAEFSYLNVKKQDEKFIDLDGQSIGEIQKHTWDGYAFDDKMINNRKPNYWSLIGRAGISVGIGNR